MEGLKRTYGMAEPIKRGMELGIVRQGEWRPGALGGSAGVSGDILEGRDTEIAWEDVFTGKSRGDMCEGFDGRGLC
jgi:proteasome maturation protein